MASNLQWQPAVGEWQHEGSNSLNNTGGHAISIAHAGMQDFVFSARITPEKNEEPQAGVIFRSDTSGQNCYVFRARQRGLFMLVKVVDGAHAQIAGRIPVPVDDSYTLTVIATGWRLLCFVDGRKVYDITDRSPHFGEHIGLITLNTAAHFEGMQVEPIQADTLRTRTQALAKEGVVRRARDNGFRYHVIDLHGRSGYISTGDLDGDGRLDFVATQGSRCMTAVTQEGEILWTIDNPQGHVIMHPECQMPTSIYDIDADGANEVVCAWYRDGQQYLRILDGRTGAVKRERAWDNSAWPDATRAPIEDLLHANLRGRKQPQDMVVLCGYAGIWALTDELEMLWGYGVDQFPGKGGPLPWLCHTPQAADLDGDGCDEILTGGMLLDQDGKVLWSLDLEEELGDSHVDSIRLGDIDGNPANGKEIAFSTSGSLINAQGQFLWKHRALVLHGQTVRVGKIRADLPGLQVLVLDCGTSPGSYLFAADGELILKLPPGDPALPDWNGDGLAEISIHNTLYDSRGKAIAVFPIEEIHTAYGYDYPKNSYSNVFAADIMGDSRDELVWSSGDLIIIFENAALNPNPPLRFTEEEKVARWKRLFNTRR